MSKTKLEIAIDLVKKLFLERSKEEFIVSFTSLNTEIIDTDSFKKNEETKLFSYKRIQDDKFINIYSGLKSGYNDIGIKEVFYKGEFCAIEVRFLKGFRDGSQTVLALDKKVRNEILKKNYKKNPKNKLKNIKPGLYKLINIQDVTYYESFKTEEYSVFHQEYRTLKNDMNFFFENLERFHRNNMPGIRRVLLHGEPGTGKTTGALKTATEFKEHIICIATTYQSLYDITNTEIDYPLIVICEDLENLGNSSDILNWLDGQNTKKMNKGLYVIFTSNNFNKIDYRISKRPGRIDKLFKIGPLDDENSFAVAKLYFNEIELQENYFNNFTGAQIKELSNVFFNYCISNNLNLEEKYIPEVIKEMKDMYNVSYDNILKSDMFNKKSTLGFKNDNY